MLQEGSGTRPSKMAHDIPSVAPDAVTEQVLPGLRGKISLHCAGFVLAGMTV